MQKIRKDIINHKLKEIIESVELVHENLPENFEEFKRLGIIKDGIYKRIENAIESVINICSIINSDLGLGIPSSEEDIIKNLENKKIISKKLAERIREMKGFRNLLVHRYGKINDELAFENVKEGIKDFSFFSEEIKKFLERKVI